MRKVVKVARVKRDAGKTRPKLSDKQLHIETMRSATRRRLRQHGYLFTELHRAVPHSALGDIVFPDGGRPVFIKYASPTRTGQQPLSEFSAKLDDASYLVVIVDRKTVVEQQLLPLLLRLGQRAQAFRKFRQGNAQLATTPAPEAAEEPETQTEGDQEASTEEGAVAIILT